MKMPLLVAFFIMGIAVVFHTHHISSGTEVLLFSSSLIIAKNIFFDDSLALFHETIFIRTSKYGLKELLFAV